MDSSQHSLLAACFTFHSINATLAMVPQCGAGLWDFHTTFPTKITHLPWQLSSRSCAL